TAATVGTVATVATAGTVTTVATAAAAGAGGKNPIGGGAATAGNADYGSGGAPPPAGNPPRASLAPVAGGGSLALTPPPRPVPLRSLPFTDLPEHVAAIAALSRLLPGGGGAPEYVLEAGQSQYLLYDLAGALLTRVTSDAVLANRLVLFAVAISWPYAFRA